MCVSVLDRDRDRQIGEKRQKDPFCCVYVLVSIRQKRQLCVHSCHSSVDADTVCTTVSVYVCVHPCVKRRVGGVNGRDGDGDTDRESEKET